MKTRFLVAITAAVAALGVTAAIAGDGIKRLDADGDGFVTQDEFKAEQIARIEERFSRIDANADGLLSEEELRAAHQARRHGPPGMHKRPHGHKIDPEQMVERIDEDGSGGLSLAEMAGKPFSPDAETFDAADLDGSGELDPAELKEMMKAHRAERRARDRNAYD